MRVCGGARQARNACVRAPCPAPGYPHPHPPQAAKRAGVRRSLAAPHAALVGPPARSPQCPRFRTLTSSHAARALGDRWGRGHTHCRRIWTSSAKQLQLHLTAPGARTVPTGAGGGTRACCGAAAPLPDCGGALWVEGGAAPATVWRSSCSSTPQMASFPRPAIHPSSNGRSVWSGSCPQTAHSVDAAGSVCGREA